jgi:ketosteroid isomerase-like protein
LYEPGTQRFTFGDITAHRDRAVLEWRVQGIAAATGLPYDNAYCGVFTIRSGHIVEVREYLDSLHAAEVLFAR